MIPKKDWVWYGFAGHWICANGCRYHLCTRIGSYLVSTIGAYFHNDRQEPVSSSENDFYQTMVFHCNGDDKHGVPNVTDRSPVHTEHYENSEDAEQGHRRWCDEIASLPVKTETDLLAEQFDENEWRKQRTARLARLYLDTNPKLELKEHWYNNNDYEGNSGPFIPFTQDPDKLRRAYEEDWEFESTLIHDDGYSIGWTFTREGKYEDTEEPLTQSVEVVLGYEVAGEFIPARLCDLTPVWPREKEQQNDR